MRIEIQDDMGYLHRIDSGDWELIGKWFAEKAGILISADVRYNHPLHMDIWPVSNAESQMIGKRRVEITQDSLLEFARYILEVSEKLGEIERDG